MHARQHVVLGLAIAGLLAFAGPRLASAQRPDPEHHAGGRITAISGTTITVAHRDKSTRDIVVTASTTYSFEHKPATLADFAVGDFLGAEGAKGTDGRFVADKIFGGTEPPPPPDGRFDPEHTVGGKIVSVDAAAKTITVSRPDGETDVIHTTDTTTFERNRKAATLADFKAGDHAMAHGDRDANDAFVADHVGGGDRKPDRPQN
jgi:hypothetical protein